MKRILALSLAGFLLLGTGTAFAEDSGADTDHTVLLTLPKDQTTPAFTHGKAASLPLRIINMRSPGQVFTKAQLYEKINGEYFENDDSTMMVHISNLRDKIEKDSKDPRYIKTVRGVGYKFEKL